MVGLRAIAVPVYIRSIGPYLVLPGIVLLGLLAILGPDLWSAIYASAKFCRTYMAEVSPVDALGTLTIFLISGLIVVALFAAVRELFRLRMLSNSIARAKRLPHGLPGSSLLVKLDDNSPFAFCHGLLHPRAYFSSGLASLLSPDELEAVLLHEAVHVRRRDPLRVLIARVVAAGLFALPLARLVRDRYLARLETAADREVVSQKGPAPLAAALIKLLQATPPHAMGAALSSFNPTRERISQLAGAHSGRRMPLVPPRHLQANALSVLSSVLLTGFVTYGATEFLMATPFCRVPMV